jgi:hypothetical protein
MTTKGVVKASIESFRNNSPIDRENDFHEIHIVLYQRPVICC